MNQYQSSPASKLESLKDNLNVSKIKDKVTASVSEVTQNTEHHEGKFTKTLENQTAKIPSGTWLSLAIGSMFLSTGILALSRKKEYATFVGLWAPSFMLIGIYNKLVKLEGNDKHDSQGIVH